MRSRVKSRPLTLFTAAVIGLVGLIPATSAEAHSKPPFDLTFPQETSKTHFASTFGARRSGGRRHKGNDLMAERMTEVYAVADGVITDISYHYLSGRAIRISHVDGWSSAYMHLNNDTPGTDDGDAPWSLTVAPGIAVGTEVIRGQLIGWVGDSGNAETTAPHTHFELRLNGRAVNPYDWLLHAYEEAVARELALKHAIDEHLDVWYRLDSIDLAVTID